MTSKQCDICGKDIDHGGFNLSAKAIYKDSKFQIIPKTKGNINICDDCMFELFYVEIPLFIDKRPNDNIIDIDFIMPMTKLLKRKKETIYSKKKIAKNHSRNKAYNTKKNYVTKTLGKDYHTNSKNRKK